MNIQMDELYGIGLHDKHTSLAALKALMLKTPTTIIEKKELHVM
jgi:hypothetical protein